MTLARTLEKKIWAGRCALLPYLPLPVRLPWGSWWLAWNDVVGRNVCRRAWDNVICRHVPLDDYSEEGEQRFLMQFLKPGMTVLDIGAHQGLYTLLASRRVGPSGRVIVFEPSPRELQRLRWNLFLNRSRNVHVVASALGSEEGTADLFVCLGQETGCNSLRPPAVSEPIRKVRVPIMVLDRYLEKNSVGDVDFVKLDVEGAELAVFKGAVHLLNSSSPVVLCELSESRTRPWRYRSAEIYEFLERRDYRWFSITPEGKLQPCAKKQSFNENLIAVPINKLTLAATFS